MRERPILMSAPMVKAILAGTKTQTRRIVKIQSDEHGYRASMDGDGAWLIHGGGRIKCPYGVVGERLWVRETWRFEGTDMMRHGRSHCTQDGVIRYLADDTRRTINTDWRNVETWMKRNPQNRPGIHMPRWASRITLEITDVRVERLQEISEADAIAEGLEWRDERWATYGTDGCMLCGGSPDPIEAYRCLWININGTGSWDANPWVWALTFRRVVGA